MIPYIVWQDTYSVGIPAIDVQHKMVIDLLNKNYTVITENGATRAYVDQFLDRLLVFTETHFQYEEKLMKLSGHQGREEHARFHREMALSTKGISLSLNRGFQEQFELAHRMLRDWWLHHMLEIDKQYISAMKNILA